MSAVPSCPVGTESWERTDARHPMRSGTPFISFSRPSPPASTASVFTTKEFVSSTSSPPERISRIPSRNSLTAARSASLISVASSVKTGPPIAEMREETRTGISSGSRLAATGQRELSAPSPPAALPSSFAAPSGIADNNRFTFPPIFCERISKKAFLCPSLDTPACACGKSCFPSPIRFENRQFKSWFSMPTPKTNSMPRRSQ
ncbi:MAG: hypothetical protein A4E61_00265 [Syntrophorhabdus sp. PtaB.Bin184]|nr:MAG: hypothetical protein A4E61_00265 [Syntrophorhabdus sp. PtaB.Bin184]